MHHIQTLVDGEVVAQESIATRQAASLRYCRLVLRLQRTGGHIRWVEGDALPTMPPTVIAEWFGEGRPERPEAPKPVTLADYMKRIKK